MVSRVDPASASAVAERARTENFPVASLLFPRAVRPHLRAIYGFARLVDILGDEFEGDRLEALDELESRARGLLRGRAGLGGDAPAAADDPCVRPPARAVSAPDRGEPDGSADLGVRDLGRPQGLLRSLGRPRRPARARGARPVRGRPDRALRRRLHGPPARQLPPGRSARPRARARLPAGRGPSGVRRDRARRAERAASPPARRSRPSGRAACLHRARTCGARSAGASAWRSPCSPAAGSRPSRPWTGPTGTSSTGGRARRVHGWRSR